MHTSDQIVVNDITSQYFQNPRMSWVITDVYTHDRLLVTWRATTVCIAPDVNVARQFVRFFIDHQDSEPMSKWIF